MIRIKRGLDLPIAGAPRQTVEPGPRIDEVALLGGDYPGLKPALRVAIGDRVRRGQVLFEDRKRPGLRYTAPATGEVVAIHRGERRVLQSVVIACADAEQDQSFAAWSARAPQDWDRASVRALLQESGEWTALRTRPFGRVPDPDAVPAAIFVPAIDTQPLAADPDVVIAAQLDAFRLGLRMLSQLGDGPVWVCRRAGSTLPAFAGERIREEAFAGPHPAGNPGTHIHHLCPVGRHRSVWVVGYQEVIAIGRLFAEGRLHSERVVALGGPQVESPRLLRTRVGAQVAQLVAGQLRAGESRLISGSVWSGHQARGPVAYLGRLANQVTVLPEAGERRLLGYLSPGIDRHSVFNIYLSRLLPGARFFFDTSTNGSERAMVPLGQYEQVMPLDILATPLLRALLVGDTESAEALGALELVEEDLALCSYVCAGKYEYGPILREALDRIEAEG